MDDIPRRVRIMVNCPHCGQSSDADPEFVEKLLSSGVFRGVVTHVRKVEKAGLHGRRVRRGIAVAFYCLSALSVWKAASLYFWPEPISTAQMITAQMIAGLGAYMAAYIAWNRA